MGHFVVLVNFRLFPLWDGFKYKAKSSKEQGENEETRDF